MTIPEEMKMKIVVIVARILLGLVFFVFGLNGLHPFMANPPATPPAAAFFGALLATHLHVLSDLRHPGAGGSAAIAGSRRTVCAGDPCAGHREHRLLPHFSFARSFADGVGGGGVRTVSGVELSRRIRAAVQQRVARLNELRRA